MKPVQTHTSFFKGTPLLVIFRDGRRVIDKYLEKTSKGFKLQRYGRVVSADIRTVAIYKGRDDRRR